MFKLIWQEEKIDLWVRPYKIICLSSDSGLIEPILNTVSLHQIKKNSNKSLKDYFIDEYGSDEDCDEFKQAQRNFMQSCAAYCLISYLMQVKDRYVVKSKFISSYRFSKTSKLYFQAQWKYLVAFGRSFDSH